MTQDPRPTDPRPATIPPFCNRQADRASKWPQYWGLYSQTVSNLRRTQKTLEGLSELKQTYALQEAKADEEIRTLELRLQDVKRERLRIIHNTQNITNSIIQMEAVIQDLRSTLSPIKAMPNEVLFHIFSDHCHSGSMFNRQPAALTLTGVCSRWRSLVEAHPSLWSSLYVKAAHLESVRVTGHAQLIRHVIERGQRSQQSLSIWKWKHDQHGLIKEAIKIHNTPWKLVKLILPGPAMGPLDVEHLQANSVEIIHPHEGIQEFLPVMRFASTLIIHAQPYNWGNLPWMNLRVLTLSDGASKYSYAILQDVFRGALRAAPRMTELHLALFVESSRGTVMPTESLSISHSKLESMSLHWKHFSLNGEPFGIQLDTPALAKVSIRGSKRKAVAGAPSFYRHWSQPTHLTLKLPDEATDDAAELLRWHPCVETLEIVAGKTDILFTLLYTMLDQTGAPNDPLPLPKLTTLHIENTDLRGETLLALLDARLRHVQDGTPGFRALTNIYMYETPGVTADDWKLVTERLEIGRTLNGEL